MPTKGHYGKSVLGLRFGRKTFLTDEPRHLKNCRRGAIVFQCPVFIHDAKGSVLKSVTVFFRQALSRPKPFRKCPCVVRCWQPFPSPGRKKSSAEKGSPHSLPAPVPTRPAFRQQPLHSGSRVSVPCCAIKSVSRLLTAHGGEGMWNRRCALCIQHMFSHNAFFGGLRCAEMKGS